jgi:hypothetical protein
MKIHYIQIGVIFYIMKTKLVTFLYNYADNDSYAGFQIMNRIDGKKF